MLAEDREVRAVVFKVLTGTSGGSGGSLEFGSGPRFAESTARPDGAVEKSAASEVPLRMGILRRDTQPSTHSGSSSSVRPCPYK
jgi:hypothetical protein